MSNMQAYDRLSALVDQIGQYKEARRQREIDEKATGMLQQGAQPEEVEKFLVGTIAPERRGGLGGIADRLVGGAAPPQTSPMQRHAMSGIAEREMPTPSQEADKAQAGRAADMHEPEMRQIEANIKRLELAGDPNFQVFGDLSRTVNDLSVASFYNSDPMIKQSLEKVSGALAEAIDNITNSQKGDAQGTTGGGVQAGYLGGPIDPNLSGTAPGTARSAAKNGKTRMASGRQQAWDLMDTMGSEPQAKATAQQPDQSAMPVRFSQDTPPSLQDRIKRLMEAGIPIEQIIAADEVQPYLIRE